MRIRASLVIIIAVAATLGGCSGAAAPEPSPTSSATPTATTPSLPEGPVGQVPLDCSAAIPDATLKAVLGHPVPRESPVTTPFFEAQQQQRGSLDCVWRSDSPYSLVFISVQRDGAARLAGERPDIQWDGAFGIPESTMSCIDEGNQCQVTALVGDYLVWAHASFGPGVTAGQESAFHQLFDAAFDTLATEPVPARWKAAAGAWPAIVDCGALAAVADPPAAAGVPGMTVRDTTAERDGYTLPRDVAALGGLTTCRWSDPAGTQPDARIADAAVWLLSGGAWLWRNLLPGTAAIVEPLDLPGSDESALVCLADSCAVYLRYGMNVAQVTGDAGYLGDDVVVSREDLLAMAEAVATAIPLVVG